jgi:hypothetical protein
MGPFYHLQVGSFLANARGFNLRQRRMIMFSALLTDLDGLPGLVNPDWMNLHHTFSHNLFFSLVIAGIFSVLGRSRRPELFVFCFASSILQVVLDNLTNDVSWSIMYFWPVWQKDFSLADFSSWEHLNSFVKYGVQGAFMVAVLAGTIILYLRTGRTFIEVFSARLDKFITDFLTLPFKQRCAICNNRAFYRESDTQAPLCGSHARIRMGLQVEQKMGEGKT